MLKPEIEIRDVVSIDEIHEVELLQKEIWGIPDIEVVPMSQLVAAIHSGGVLVGAFDDAQMVGFVYGFAGDENGRAVHHSHMLAVRQQYRAHDLGFRLKLAQRERVLKQGVGSMTWTFDPLQSMNSYFNFAKLGVFADTYFVDFYGTEAASFLHQIGTDRLWVTWPLLHKRTVERITGNLTNVDSTELVRLVRCADGDRPVADQTALKSSRGSVAIEIPFSINRLQESDRALGVVWRKAVREAFINALEAGFVVEDFLRGEENGSPGFYILSKGKASFD